MEQYCVGGLEELPDDKQETIIMGGTEYLLTDKFKTMLRDSFIDWGTFLEVYHDNMDNDTMFKQIVKLLNVKDTKNLRATMLQMLKKIHGLPAKAHIACMMKQFMIYEPVSIAIQMLFNTIKSHYEHIVELFNTTRNEYIIKKSLLVKPNNWDALMKTWVTNNNKYDLDSSSIILLMLNHPSHVKSRLHFKTPGVNEVEKLCKEIKKFNYLGFCPRVPHTRLIALLKFPLDEFVTAIKAMNPNTKLPNYQKIESTVGDMLKNAATKPKIPELKHNMPDSKLVSKASVNNTSLSNITEENQLNLAKWYVSDILEYRKKLLSVGQAYEQYYVDIAKMLYELNTVLNKLLD
jgi:hypothetical protein